VLGLFQTAGRDITWLGHVSWRLLFFVRLGLALAAIPVFVRLGEWIALRKAATWRTVTAGAGVVLLILFSWGLSRPLGALILHSDSSEMQEVRRLWSWLEENRKPAWGRVYLQDTFGGPGVLGSSHVLALTHRETGIDQVGPLYEGSPFPTVAWLVAESRKIFGSPLRSAGDFKRMLRLVPAANVTRLVLYWPDLAAEMVKKGYAAYEYHQGDFAVLALVDNPHSSWAAPLERGMAAAAERVGTGRWRVTTDAPGPGGSALVKASWSPHWKVSGGDGPTVAGNELGLISLENLPAGRHLTMLEYRRPRWPGLVSAAGWGLWVVILAGWRFVPAMAARMKAVEDNYP
jgi:hypothetical protein